MNIFAAVVPGHRPLEPAWVSPEPGLYIAVRDGHSAGSVVTTESGDYIALDVGLDGIGRYGTLDEAKRSVGESGEGRDNPVHYPWGFVVATVVGAAALLTASLALAFSVWR